MKKSNKLSPSTSSPYLHWKSVQFNLRPLLENPPASTKRSHEHCVYLAPRSPTEAIRLPRSPGARVQWQLAKAEPATKCSTIDNGCVKAYGAATAQGLVRHSNEDRVGIVLNLAQPTDWVNGRWPCSSFFGVYDGHGGAGCAEFLRDNLHLYVIQDKAFPSDPKEAIRAAFEAAEQAFLSRSAGVDQSGSCAVVALVVDDTCYIANVGDSHAVLSSGRGTTVLPLTNDHTASRENTCIQQQEGCPPAQGRRVKRGRLSVSRAFGDVSSKLSNGGSLPKVLMAQPEIHSFKITAETDCLILGCGSVFDCLTNQEMVQGAWRSLAQDRRLSVHQQCGAAVETILRSSLNRRSLDNLTAVFVAFEGFAHHYEKIAKW